MNNSLSVVHPELIVEWSKKNLPLTPDGITFGSNKVVWWKGSCGHEWQTSVKARSKGEKCPICSGARAVAGINDLSTLKPGLASEWSKKNEIKPTEVTVGSHKKVIWKCRLGHVTDQIVLTIGYDIENLTDPDRSRKYKGDVTIDRYGRRVPKHAHGTTNLKRQTSSTMLITDAVMELYDRIVDKNLLIRRINITANRLVDENAAKKEEKYEQLDLFTDYKAKEQEQVKEEAALEREKRMQQTMLTIKKKFGKNAILKGMNLQEGATAKDRNEQIGGHKA